MSMYRPIYVSVIFKGQRSRPRSQGHVKNRHTMFYNFKMKSRRKFKFDENVPKAGTSCDAVFKSKGPKIGSRNCAKFSNKMQR